MHQHALIVGKFAPLHSGHQLLIETALAESRNLTVLCYATPDFVAMPNEMRSAWIRLLYSGVDVRVPRGAPDDSAGDAEHRLFVKAYLAEAGLQPDAVFSSAEYGPGFAAAIGAAHVMVDAPRSRFPVSGSAIRANPEKYRAYLDALVFNEIGGLAGLNNRR